VLDNNTPDAEVWRPVEAHCRKLGSRFRFFHFDGVKGFKGGALNRALALTDSDARYIAVIDSDYQVQPFWLRRVIPYFASPGIAWCRDRRTTARRPKPFKAMAYEEYRLFHIGGGGPTQRGTPPSSARHHDHCRQGRWKKSTGANGASPRLRTGLETV
jgi:cellulose synthase/poly-beta-1,6-N-acetylglucosamine synthase-like glycosyltransferase